MMMFITVSAQEFVCTMSPNWLGSSELPPSLSSAPPPPSTRISIQDLFFSPGWWDSSGPSLLALAPSLSYLCHSLSVFSHSLCFGKGPWAPIWSRSRPESIVWNSSQKSGVNLKFWPYKEGQRGQVSASLRACTSLCVRLSLPWPGCL